MKLSIIIPTLNEEKTLLELLKCIKRENLKDYEVIVSDAKSNDNTRKIAKQYGCKIIDGGKPAVSRNKGAKSAKGDILLFLDADVILPSHFIKKSLREFNGRELSLATSQLRAKNGILIDHLIFGFVNQLSKLSPFIQPHGVGACIFVKRELFNMVKGFDEGLFLYEDHDFVNRCAKVGKFRVLHTYYYFSLRRYEKNGRLKEYSQNVMSWFYYTFFGPIRKKIFDYKMGGHLYK